MNDLAIRENVIPTLSVGPFVVTRTGLILEHEPNWEEWQAFFEGMHNLEDAIQWNIGDALLHTEIKYGEAAAQLTANYPEYKYSALRQYRWVAENVKYVTRVTYLSWSHHREVATLKSKEQNKWLKKAVDKGWNVKELRIEIKKYLQLTKAKERQKLISQYGDRLWIGDFRKETERIKDNSIDIILTDPPYAEEAVSFYNDLSRIAARVLRPSGLCLTYCGHYFLPHYYSAMGKELEYLWTGAVRHTGGESRFRKFHIHVGWKPVLIYGKPPVDTWWEWWSDNANVLEMHSDGKDKKYHEWGQPEGEAAYYLKYLCPQNGVVLDPMCGGGTVLAAAQRLELQYIGIEIDEYTALTAMQRLDGHDKA